VSFVVLVDVFLFFDKAGCFVGYLSCFTTHPLSLSHPLSPEERRRVRCVPLLFALQPSFVVSLVKFAPVFGTNLKEERS
jgi:hypothetical protein